MKLNYNLKLFFLTLTCLCLTSCGFHLVNYKKNLPSICLKGIDKDEIRIMLKSKCTKNSYILEIKDSSFSQYDITTSANNTLRQYQLKQYIIFDLLNPKHKVISNNIKLSISKPLVINNNSILSSNVERSIILSEMKQVLIHRLTNYIKRRLQ